MASISTHVLDTSTGRPAAGVPLTLERHEGTAWVLVGGGLTDADGRNRTLVPDGAFGAGPWRLTFDTASYFRAMGVEGFYPEVRVDFVVRDPAQHHHVPLLLSPFGYSTYRGS